MLTAGMIRSVTAEALEYWKQEVTNDYFVEIARGKEVGHKLADLVDEKTTALLTLKHRTGYQRSSTGKRRARSMVKMAIRDDTGHIEPSVVFTDMLDWLDYVTFDSGPGQMMLKAKSFLQRLRSIRCTAQVAAGEDYCPLRALRGR